MKCGDILFFYQSHSEKTIQVCGIVEKLSRSKKVEEILTITGKRTVYNQAEIKKMRKTQKEKLVILFRQAKNLKQKIKFDDLLEQSLVKGVPQTITKLSQEAKLRILQQKPF